MVIRLFIIFIGFIQINSCQDFETSSCDNYSCETISNSPKDKRNKGDWNKKMNTKWNASKKEGYHHINTSDFSGGFHISFGGNLSFLGSGLEKDKSHSSKKESFPLHLMKDMYHYGQKPTHHCKNNNPLECESDTDHLNFYDNGHHGNIRPHKSYPVYHNHHSKCNSTSEFPCEEIPTVENDFHNIGIHSTPAKYSNKAVIKDKDKKYEYINEKAKSETHQLKTPHNIFTKTITYNQIPRKHAIDYSPGWIKKKDQTPILFYNKPHHLRHHKPCYILDDGTHVVPDDCKNEINSLNLNSYPNQENQHDLLTSNTYSDKPTIGDLIDDNFYTDEDEYNYSTDYDQYSTDENYVDLA